MEGPGTRDLCDSQANFSAVIDRAYDKTESSDEPDYLVTILDDV